MKKLLLPLFLFSCAAPVTEVSKEYAAAIDVGCFLFGLQNGENPEASRAITARCLERMSEMIIRAQVKGKK